MPFFLRVLAVEISLAVLVGGRAFADDTQQNSSNQTSPHAVLATYCVSCHGPKKQNGKIRFDALETIDSVDLQKLLVSAQDAVHLKEMPPDDAKQPSEAERKALLDWFASQLTGEAAKKLEEKLRRPESGNYVDHDALFSGEHADKPGYTNDRRWLISEYIFDAKFNRLLNHKPHFTIDGTRRFVFGSNNRRVNLTNPFLLPGYTGGVRYYANETLNGGHLLTMLTNAKETATHMMYLAGRDKRYMPAISQVMAMEDQHTKTLASRQDFLEKHIDRVLQDTFGGKHTAMLPEFVAVEVPAPIAEDSEVKKAPYHAANPGRDEVMIIFRSMRRLKADGQTQDVLIDAMEREWFYHGHNQRKIEARLTFLQNYMEEFLGQIEQHQFDKRNRRFVYKPLSDEEMQVVTDAVRKHRNPGDRFNAVTAKCMAQWEAEFDQALIDAGSPPDEQVDALIEQLFVKILERSPSPLEAQNYRSLTQSYVANLGRRNTIEKLIQTLILNTEFVYRQEFGQGKADQYGRRMMSPRDASYSLAYALTDSSPDAELAKAVTEGRLSTRADYEREVRRMLANREQYYIVDESVNKQNDIANFTNMPIRELRFFREFFGYPKMLSIFKDNKRFGSNYDAAKKRLVAEADRLIEHIIEKDADVINEMLTTDKFYVYHSGNNEAMQASSQRVRKIYDYFKDKNWQEFTTDDLIEHKEFIGETKMRGINVDQLKPGGRYNPLNSFKKQIESFTLRLDKGQTAAAPYNSFPAHGMANASSRYNGRLQSPDVARFYGIDMYDWDYQPIQPAKMPQRKGMLTHPAWLIAFAQNTETDPIHRGIWVREKLLAGTIPDVPITVDAVIPEDPHKTLRQRLDAKTNNDYCMSCHVKINPLGIPFEIFDDFGRYRTQERLEYPENLIKKSPDKGGPEQDLRDLYKTLPVDSAGFLQGSGDSELDGEVTDALDLVDRMAKSDRVRQSVVRHAFRYFMGRNETLSDSKTLIDADRAYQNNGGSFDELIVSLLTSDSFIFRKAPETKDLADAQP